MEGQAVIRWFGLAQGRELVIRGPVELATVDDSAAGDRAIAGQVFGGGVHNQSGPMLDRAAKVWRGRGVVDDQRDFGGICNFGDGIEIRDVPTRVGNRFSEHGARVVINGGLHSVQIVKVDESRLPSEPFDGVAELGDGAAVKAGGDDHILAW